MSRVSVGVELALLQSNILGLIEVVLVYVVYYSVL